MKKTLFLFALLYTPLILSSQVFPEDWIGQYAGEMIIYRNTMILDSVDVQFDLLNTDEGNWTYRMRYSSSKYGDSVKDYLITQPDSLSKNHYYLDEQDGIVIDMVLIDDCFYSNFSVAGNSLQSIMRWVKGDIYFEIFMGKNEANLITKNIPIKKEDQVFEVKSFPPNTVQKVFLKKIN